MRGLGSGDSGEWTFLDLITLISFFVGLQNLDMNITQEDMQHATEKLDKALRKEVEDIHRHLEIQDQLITTILEKLGGVDNVD